ncbi:MAG: translation initiation factor IF-2 [Marinifilaceae bacterium]|jgi:translation initiation factor IF-2|nr:translation initiation factor IF-2 [Marinifilaceae bacterium]
MADKKIRLNKVARDFNVGVSTLVDFLKSAGHKVDSNPNTQITEEQLSILKKEYSSDIKVKKEAKKVDLKSTRAKKETVTIEKENKEQPTDIDKKKIESNIKVVGKIELDKKSSTKKSVAKKVDKVEKTKKVLKVDKVENKPNKQDVSNKEQKKEENSNTNTTSIGHKIKDEVKVVGKIDLDAINQRTRPTRKTKAEKDKERKKKELDKKKNNNDHSSDGQKRKRKRINKKDEKVDIKSNVEKGKVEHKKKKRVKKKPIIKAEVSEEDVQKQIKETLARLTSKGKSKGSRHRKDKREAYSQKRQAEEQKAEQEKHVLKIAEFVTCNELATMMDVPVNEIISACMTLGLFVSINQRLDAETINLVADEFGFEVSFINAEEEEENIEEEVVDDPSLLEERPPIITVMGHVDHGKTSLLDYIRHANVIAGEAGGITQHIGAYNVTLKSGKKITFLDTPGHEAFTAMRARGAQVTDIAIIIIAADDNVMPQTVEAINHASAAGVPIVFAINKIDKPGANPDKVKEELANMNYLVEDWGGKYQCQEISAKSGLNVEELMEKVLLEAELLEVKANPNKPAVGTIIESSLDKGRGYVTTVLVQGGTMKIGDVMLAGQYTGHVKAMFNERNKKITEVHPGEPAIILGLNGAPQAGDKFKIYENEKDARGIANRREQIQREQGIRTQKHITLDEIGRRIAIGNFQELNVIVKGDVDGSIEALSDSLIKLSTEEIQVNVIHKAVGQISEGDVMLATASNAIIIGFQVRPSLGARRMAEHEEIDIRLYSIIYDAIEDVKSAMEGMLSPEIKEEITAQIEVLNTFKISKVGTIAGCLVREGKIKRNNKIRLIRDGIVVYSGELGALKRFKDDVKEVATGYECGISINNYNDIKVGDFIEAFEEVEVKKKL